MKYCTNCQEEVIGNKCTNCGNTETTTVHPNTIQDELEQAAMETNEHLEQ